MQLKKHTMNISKKQKKIWYLIIIFGLLNLLIIATDNIYLYKAVWYNFANIDDNSIFEERIIAAGIPQPWPLAVNYNRPAMPNYLSEELEKRKSVAFLIIKDDSLQYEAYWDGYGKNSISNSFSMAKTFVSILVGIAIDEGKIESLDEPVSDFIPEFEDEGKEKITLRHLITMSSGLDWNESYANPFSATTKAYYGRDLYSLITDQESIEKPGQVFKYLSGNTQLLAFVLEKVTGKKLSDYFSEKLWKPLGAENAAEWSLDREGGVEKAYCCVYSNARDFARIGSLFMHKGNWKGRQLISEEYVKESILPAPLLDEQGRPNTCYGYAWWIIPNYKGLYIYYARGILGQYIIVIPEKNMIIARLGEKRGNKLDNDHYSDLFKYIDGALEMY